MLIDCYINIKTAACFYLVVNAYYLLFLSFVCVLSSSNEGFFFFNEYESNSILGLQHSNTLHQPFALDSVGSNAGPFI